MGIEGNFQYLPPNARIFPLKAGTKIPEGGRGHLDARPIKDWKPGYFEGKNYGIALDGQFLIVDYDDEDLVTPGFSNKLEDTYYYWSQHTRRGRHFLFRVPEGFSGTNVKIPGAKGAGDIKCKGYIVGPGSVVDDFEYSITNSSNPRVAPGWLLALCKDTRGGATPTGEDDRGQDLQIKEGEGRNQFLVRVAGSLKGLGLSTEQTKSLVRDVNRAVSSPPLVEAELVQTIDKSIERWAPGNRRIEGELDGPFNVGGWINAAVVPIVRPPISWWEWGFIPKGILVLQYGRGGIGKSTLAAWLAGKITTAGGRFGVVTREDPFELFANRARLSGADPALIWSPKEGGMLFPRDAEKLQSIVEEMKLDFLYFDSIYDHFEANADLHAGERTRRSLSPLAGIAASTGCTIMGTFHTNKTGKFMGSTEMENVSRVLLEATRGDSPNSPLSISVVKSNFKKPDFSLQFSIKESRIVDQVTGEVQQEEKRDGTFGDAMLSYAEKQQDLPFGAVNIDSISSPSSLAEDYIVECLGLTVGGRTRSTELKSYVLNQGISERTFERALTNLVGSGDVKVAGPTNNRLYYIED